MRHISWAMPSAALCGKEIMIYLPARIQSFAFVATIGNGEEIARWLESIRKNKHVLLLPKKNVLYLYILFFCTIRAVCILFWKEKSLSAVADFIRRSNEKRLRGEECPDFHRHHQSHGKFNLLPAIFFLKSRRNVMRRSQRVNACSFSK